MMNGVVYRVAGIRTGVISSYLTKSGSLIFSTFKEHAAVLILTCSLCTENHLISVISLFRKKVHCLPAIYLF